MSNPVFMAMDLSTFTPTATSTNSSFPLANLQDYLLTNVWKSNSTSAQSLVFDFGAAVTIDSALIVGHNIPSLGILTPDTLSLQCAADSGFSSGLVTCDNSLGAQSADPMYVTFASQTKRYWRLLFPTGMSTQPMIGKLILCVRLDFGTPYNFDFKPGVRKYETTQRVALDGLIRTSQAMKARKIWQIAFESGNGLTDAIRNQFVTFFATVRGKLRPFYFIDMDGSKYYVHLDTDIDPSEVHRYNLNTLKIPMISQTVS